MLYLLYDPFILRYKDDPRFAAFCKKVGLPIYVLEGTLRYTVDGETRDLGPGEAMATPRGVVHAFSNPHALVARALVINTPDIGPGYFREIGSIVNAGGPPDRAALLATMQRYGLTLAVPQSN